MKTSYYIVFITFFTFFIFQGCGNDFETEEQVNANKNISTGGNSGNCAEAYFELEISPILNKCVSCHNSDGKAKATGLVFGSTDRFATLSSYVKTTDTKIIQKNNGSLSHEGGALFTSANSQSMQTFINYVNDPSLCQGSSSQLTPIQFSSVPLMSPSKALRSAALVMTGEVPSKSTLDSTTDEATLDQQLDVYMQSDAFYQWLRLRFNDILLTERYDRGSDGVNLLDSDDFPDRYWYYGTEDDRNMLGETNVTIRDQKYNRVRAKNNYGVATAPLQLMTHVIRENRPFSEILTADYMMVNPYSSRTYGFNIPNFTFGDADDDELEKFSQENFREVQLPGYKHAGIISDPMFLNRFTTTSTNRNRHRSAKYQKFFLDTDILGLADRPIDSTEADKNSHNPTLNNPNCTVCHLVMDPIAGAFQNWDYRGRYRPLSNGWYLDMLPPGFSVNEPMNGSDYETSLQWLADKTVHDERFVTASIKMFYKALLGRDALSQPHGGDENYAQKLQAYNFQKSVFTQIAQRFKASNMNAKVIIKELIKSPFFRGYDLEQAAGNEVFANQIGQAHLIAPEQLDAKIYSVTGYYWAPGYYQDRPDRHYLMNEGDYRTLYGGINSNSITTRVSELNGVMANIQLRMAVDMSCYPVARDFFFPAATRKMFPYVETDMEPTSSTNIAKIKQNIQYLHERMWGEELAVDDPEILRTYELFQTVYSEGKARVEANDIGYSRYMSYPCYVTKDPVTGESLSGDRYDERIHKDDTYVIRAWRAVITYMLSDFKFLYENSGQ